MWYRSKDLNACNYFVGQNEGIKRGRITAGPMSANPIMPVQVVLGPCCGIPKEILCGGKDAVSPHMGLPMHTNPQTF